MNQPVGQNNNKKWFTHIAVVFSVAALVIFAVQSYHWRAFTHDDAWISFRYSENLVNGHGLVWNPGERVEGYTNFLWTLLMAVPIALRRDPVPVSKILGILFSLASLGVIFRFAQRLLSQPAPLHSAGMVLLLAASAPFAFWSVGGMETPMFGFLTLLGLYLTYCYIRNETDSAQAGQTPGQCDPPSLKANRAAASGAGLVLTFNMMTRPDGLVVWGVLLLYCTVILRLYRKTSFTFWLTPVLILYVPYFMWRWSYYGWLLPNTYYVRMGTDMAQSLELAGAGVRYWLSFFTLHGGWPVLILAVIGVVAGKFRFKWLFVALMLVWILHLIHAGGDEKPFARLIVPMLPVYVIFVSFGIQALGRLVPGKIRHFAVSVIYSVSTLLLLNGIRSPADRAYVNDHIFKYCIRARQVGEWIHANARPGDTMAARAIGALGYHAKIPCYDLLGIVDAHIAHLPLEPGHLTAHGKSDLIHIIRKEPTYIVFMLMEPEKLGYRRLTIQLDDSSRFMMFKRDPSLIPDQEYMAAPREHQGLLMPHQPRTRQSKSLRQN